MDTKKVQAELIKAIRGQRTQGQVSQRLGSKFNIVYKWESGRTKISWPDFVRLCKVCKVDLKSALSKSVRFHHPLDRADLLVKALGSPTDISESARVLKVSRFTYSDWLSGKRVPTLEQILKMLTSIRGLVGFLEHLVPIEQIPSLSVESKFQKRSLQALEEEPFIFVAQLAMELDAYQKMKTHQEGYLAKKLGISLARERELIEKLLQLNRIAWRNHKYEVLDSGSVSTISQWDRHKKGVHYWARFGLDVLAQMDAPIEGQKFNFLLFSVSSSTREKMQEAYRDFYFRLRALYAAEKGSKEEIMLLNTQFLSLGVKP